MFTKILGGLMLSLSLSFGSLNLANTKQADCCTQQMACCLDHLACCSECCAPEMACCADGAPCRATPQDCCLTGAACCAETQDCCRQSVQTALQGCCASTSCPTAGNCSK
jgi:hypothetical protein